MDARLWGGFPEPALAALRRIRAEASADPASAWLAGFAAARWYATRGDWDATAASLTIEPPGGLPDRMRLRHHLLRIEAALRTGNTAQAEQWLDWAEARWPREANVDLLRMNHLLATGVGPAGSPSQASESGRLALLNRGFRRAGLREITLLAPGEGLQLDNLDTRESASGTVPPTTAETGLVSILVAAFNRERTLEYAIRSLTRQTCPNIEIIIVDDGSTDRTLETARGLARQDARIKVLAHDENRGLFAARNTALAAASGDYVTQHDSDDWSHPERIARQLEPFLGESPPVATLSRLARVGPGFRFPLRPFRPMLEPVNRNFTSLLMPRRQLLDIGGWDPVVAHADKELMERLRERFGPDAIPEVCPTVPLSFFGDAPDCVTAAPATRVESLTTGARREYEQQAAYWRSRSGRGHAWPGDRPRADGNDPFFVPNALLPACWRRGREYDLILVSDLSLLGGTRRCNLAYLDACRALGMRIGVANYPHFTLRTAREIAPEYRALFQHREIDLLTREDSVHARLLLVHYPPVLQWPFAALPSIRADRHLLLVNQLPFWSWRREHRIYSPREVNDRFSACFGGNPAWVPISPLCRRLLREDDPRLAMHGRDWTPPLHRSFPRFGERRSATTDPAVIGRHSRDHWTKWPETEAATRAAYCGGSRHTVHLLGGIDHASITRDEMPNNWRVHAFDAIDVKSFLQSIDVFVHFPHEDYVEEFGRNVMEAMAAGVPCILPECFRENFGDAAVYCTEWEVQSVVDSLSTDNAYYEEMSRRGLLFAYRASSPPCVEQRLRCALRGDVA